MPQLWDPDRPWYQQYALLAVPALLLAFIVVVVGVYIFSAVPLPDDIAPEATRIVDNGGKEIGVLSPVAAREELQLEALPQHVPQAVMAAEDRNFYDHRGVSVRGVLRALFTNVRAGEIEQGGSTITQQYIKNAALTSERTFTRKAKEAVLALKMEQRYSKDQILEFYLNTIYLGRGAYGVETAARTYFGIPAAELDVNRAALLAGMIQAPERFDPAEDPGAAKLRRDYALDGMAAEGWITQQEADRIKSSELPKVSTATAPPGMAPFYLQVVKRILAEELGGEEKVYSGLTVVTEMDIRLQRLADQTLKRKYGELREAIDDERLAELPQLSGAIVTVDPRNGAVRALAGGPDFQRIQINAATARNQPGSAFKPFGLAGFVDEGNDPRSSTFPAPSQMTFDNPGSEPYEVNNFGGASYGSQTVTEATLTSTNVVYVQIAEEIGPDKVVDMAEDAGIDSELDPNLATVLGGLRDCCTPLEMAEAYATFAASGVHTESRFIKEVRNADGEVVFRQEPDSDGAIDANVTHVVSDILAQNIERGTGTRADIGRPAAGKTGTTQDSADAWFVGYVPQLSTAVWFGDLSGNNSMGDITGGSIPAETWGEYMAEAVKNLEVEEFPEPDYSQLEGEDVAPSPTAAPTETASPSPSPTECPDGQGGVIPTELGPGEGCPSPSPSPSDSPTDDASPTESESPTEDGSPTEDETTEPPPDEEPTDEESPEPVETVTEEPADTGGGADGGTGAETTDSTADEEPTAAAA